MIVKTTKKKSAERRLEIYAENLRCKHEKHIQADRASEWKFYGAAENFMWFPSPYNFSFRNALRTFFRLFPKSYRRIHCPRHLDTNSKWQLKHN